MKRTGLAVIQVLILLLVKPVYSQIDTDRYLKTALAGLRWIESQGVEAEGGGLIFPDVPGESGSPTTNLNLYHGQAGRVLAFLQATAATDEPRWRRAADAALHGMDSELTRALEAGYRDAGLYTGAAGIAAIYLQADKVLQNSPWSRNRSLSLADSILNWAYENHDGHHWNGVVDIISGAAGTGLYLLQLYEETGERRFLQGAEKAGRWLAEQAQFDGSSMYWPIGAGNQTHYPNFSHGTAGVCFFLGRLAELGDMPIQILTFSVRGSGIQWLEQHGDAGGCVIFHHEEGGEELQYASWCHGPVGTGRVFLHDLTQAAEGTPEKETALKPLVEGAEYLFDLGLEPGESPSGYWNNVGVCCGTAGMLRYMLDLYLATGDVKYLEAARTCADVLIEWAEPEGDGLKWPQAEHRVRPEFIQSQTGEMQGAAGIATSLLRLHLVESGHPELILRLPDEISIPMG